MSVHSASARPAYLALETVSQSPPSSFGSLGPTSRLVPGTLALSHACAGAGRRGGQRRRSLPTLKPGPPLGPLFPLPLRFPCWWLLLGLSKCCDHSRENLNENARCVDVAGGVSLSELEVLACSTGLARASAVSLRASSRVLVGLLPRLLVGEEGAEADSLAIENVEGSIFPMNVQRFLLGVEGDESAVNFGFALSAVSSFASVASEE